MAEEPNQRPLGGQPLLVLSEESQRMQGKDAQSMNIAAAKAVGETVRTTLGPRGMDKMLVGDTGDIVMTNDGVTILDEMDIDHPAADMVVEVAETQEDETGDGTTTAVVIAGALLDQAEGLLDTDVHPQTIVRGYLQAADHAQAILEERAIDVDTEAMDILPEIARTAMTGKNPGGKEDVLVDLAVRAVQAVTHDERVDLAYLETETIAGGAVDASRLIEGVTVDKEPVHNGMPAEVEDARIALLDAALEVRETETDAEATVTDPGQLQQFLDREEEQLRELVDTITASGANVVFCGEGIDEMAQHFLAQEGVLAIRRTSDDDLTHLARATGGQIVSKLEDLDESHLGSAGRVAQREVGDEELLFVEECEDPRSVTLLLRGGTEHVVEGVERAIQDALDVLALVIEDSRIVPGGGATETELALELHDYADSVGGREQLAVEAFADALDAVPRTLAENSGLDPIDTLVELRSQHAEDAFRAGLAANTGEVTDMVEAGVVEPLGVKRQALASAQEAANLIVRIDDVIAAGESEEAEGPPAGGPPGGPGGMPGGAPGGGMGGL